MDNLSFLQYIETISELRFRYMKSYNFDEVPQQTKFFFARMNSPQLHATIEENSGSWLFDWTKKNYFADSLGRKRFNNFFLAAHVSTSFEKLIVCQVLRNFFNNFCFLNFTRKTWIIFMMLLLWLSSNSTENRSMLIWFECKQMQ